MSEPKWREHWPAFEKMFKARLDKGHEEYGDDVFSRDIDSLIGEIEEELIDCIGWPFVALVRIQEMKAESAYFRRLENALHAIRGNGWVVSDPVATEIDELLGVWEAE